MRKKAEAGKAPAKKAGKANIANAAKRAIEEREAKNKTKKVYVDLWTLILYIVKITTNISKRNPNTKP